MMTKTMDGILFANMIRGGAATLSANRQLVNDLNVFPVPDGDTGDNMFMTIDSGVAALEGGGTGESLTGTASAAAKGMLLGARGNSGVILSRIFSGISRGFEGVEKADVRVIGKAFETGVDEAYSAVSTPVEGTILTVYKDAVRYAASRIGSDTTLETFFADFLKELRLSLERTPELLEVLRKAGVVDSGGAGFIYIAEGMNSALNGEEFLHTDSARENKKTLNFCSFTEDSVLEFGYCTEFFLRLQNSKTDIDGFDINDLKKYLESVGDSVVCFKEGSIVKVHVHTMKPGDILSHCQQYGEFLSTKIENMSLQHNETVVKKNYEPAVKKPRKPFGIVSVAAGDGIRELFISLGCDVVVDGGQSMNPSAEDLISAFESINADRIFVYPNNGNIILTAQQAASLYTDAEICIIPTKTIGEGYAAVSMLEADEDVASEDIIEAQKEIISGIITGMVSRAVRDTVQDGVDVKKDDYIGFAGDRIYIDSEDKNTALIQLAEKLDAGNYDIIIVLCGADITPDESDEVYDKLNEKYSLADVIMIDGRQPVYDYIIILE